MATRFRDYYGILGVDRHADDRAIKAAYRRLARRHHPDVTRARGAAEKFKEINEAYAVLSDPDKRRRYDTLGPDWKGPAPPPGAGSPFGGDVGGFSDFFRSVFGDLENRPRRGRGGRRGPAVSFEDLWRPEEPAGPPEGSVTVTLEEVVTGCSRVVEVGGRRLEVQVPAGVAGGQRIRVGGAVTLVVDVLPHPRFRRDGADVVLELPVSVPEAALGASVDVPTLRGRVSMRVPPGTSSGRRFRLPGYGLPRLDGGPRGDQIVELQVVLPAAPTAAERELYQRLAAVDSTAPRAGLE